jgi:hypothetical protein
MAADGIVADAKSLQHRPLPALDTAATCRRAIASSADVNARTVEWNETAEPEVVVLEGTIVTAGTDSKPGTRFCFNEDDDDLEDKTNSVSTWCLLVSIAELIPGWFRMYVASEFIALVGIDF